MSAIRLTDRTADSAGQDRTSDGRTITRPNRTQRPRGAFLHQTGFVNPSVDRYDVIIAHFVVLRSGQVLQVRDATAVLNSVSAGRAVDIEFEGAYPSVRQIRRARRQGREALRTLAAPSFQQYEAGRGLLAHLQQSLGITHVWAHRQASDMDRDNCPGPQLWYNVAEWAIGTLGLSNGGVRDPIPDDWKDPALADIVLRELSMAGGGDDDLDDYLDDLIGSGPAAR